MPGIFTPFENQSSNHRLKMQLSDEDSRKIGRGRWGPETVTDLTTGAVVEVQGASCGIDTCFCAAEIVRIVKPGASQPEYLD